MRSWCWRPMPTVTESELIEHARDHMAHFKVPRRVEFVTDLPKTATGKIQKYVLRSGRRRRVDAVGGLATTAAWSLGFGRSAFVR